MSTASATMGTTCRTADRCVADCVLRTALQWPDVPWDRECTASPCTSHSPTFWSTKRLATVATKTGGSPVEKWTLAHTYPDAGDGGSENDKRAALWLERISHEGLVGGSTPVPDVTFEGVQLGNRVDTHGDQYAAMNWWRIASITTETGGKIDVTYSQPDCVPDSRMPNPNALHDNTLRCYLRDGERWYRQCGD